MEMFPLISVLFLAVGVASVLFSIVERWILIDWYMNMSESTWFFWGMSAPYIKYPEGIKEFVKYRSKLGFIIGFVHVVFGVVLIPFPDFPLLILVWGFLIISLSLCLRATFINKASEINRKPIHVRQRPKKVCPKCGREIWSDLKICPSCGEKLFD
jgi:hypothetical protein